MSQDIELDPVVKEEISPKDLYFQKNFADFNQIIRHAANKPFLDGHSKETVQTLMPHTIEQVVDLLMSPPKFISESIQENKAKTQAALEKSIQDTNSSPAIKAADAATAKKPAAILASTFGFFTKTPASQSSDEPKLRNPAKGPGNK